MWLQQINVGDHTVFDGDHNEYSNIPKNGIIPKKCNTQALVE